ncbi:MAG: DMT family transporter [Hyphomicrobiaceae bacterium]
MSQARSTLGSPDRNMTGILYVLIGVLAFTIQDVIIKFLSGGYSVHQLVLFRCLGALPMILSLLVYEGGVASFLRAPHLLISLRSTIQYVSYVLWFLAIATISIADAMTIGFISPLIITALSGIILGAHVGLSRWLAILAGFAGTVVMLRPGAGVFEPAALLVLASAITYALGAILTRKIGAHASSATMSLNSLLLAILWSTLAGVFAGDGGWTTSSHPSVQLMFRAWKMPDLHDAALMLSAGVAAGVGMIVVAQAYRISQPAVIAPFEYSGMFWALIAGYAVWGQLPDAVSVAGMIVIIGAGLYIASLEGVRRKVRA